MQHRTRDIQTEVCGEAGICVALPAGDLDTGLRIVIASKTLVEQSDCTRIVSDSYSVVLNRYCSENNRCDDTLRGGGFANHYELNWIPMTLPSERIYEIENSFGRYSDRNADRSIHQRGLEAVSFNCTVHHGERFAIYRFVRIQSRRREKILAPSVNSDHKKLQRRAPSSPKGKTWGH